VINIKKYILRFLNPNNNEYDKDFREVIQTKQPVKYHKKKPKMKFIKWLNRNKKPEDYDDRI